MRWLALLLASQLTGCLTATLHQSWSDPSGDLHVIDEARVVGDDDDRRLVVVGRGAVSHAQIVLDPMPSTFLERWQLDYPLDEDDDSGAARTPTERRYLAPEASAEEGAPATVLGLDPEGESWWVAVGGRPVRVSLTVEPTAAHQVGIACLVPFAVLGDLVLLPVYLVVFAVVH